MADPFICPRCGTEIRVNDPVIVVGAEEDVRIIHDDSVFIVHETCPKEQDDDSVRV